MPIQLKWPWLGVAIPCFLIAFIGYGSHYFILVHFTSRNKQALFEFCLTMLWLSYYLAIHIDPGKSSQSSHSEKHEWTKYCKKCKILKGERTHHCKTCKQCIPMMDHHCPWTMNCVGLENFPHFMRFLFWVIVTTAFLLIQLIARITYIFKHRKLPHYMFDASELVFLTILTPLDTFVLLTIILLFCRFLSNQILSGRSQIEVWEVERLEALFYSKRLIPRLIACAKEIYPDSPVLDQQEEVIKLINNRRLRFEDVVNFPYDLDPWSNAVNLLGSPLTWLLPFGKCKENGLKFPRNEISEDIPGSSIQDLLLSLPWPPDGGRTQVSTEAASSSIESSMENGEQLVRKRSAEAEHYISRTEWQNDWGENLEDFGVDIEADLEGTTEIKS